MSGPEQFNSKQDDRASTAADKTLASELKVKLMTEVQEAFKSGTSSDNALRHLGGAVASYASHAIFGTICDALTSKGQVGAEQQDQVDQKQSGRKVNAPISSLIPSEERRKELSSSSQTKKVQWDSVTKLEAYYDQKSNCYCFDTGKISFDKGAISPRPELLKLHLSADKQSVTKIEDPGDLNSNLARLVVAGVLKEDILKEKYLGIDINTPETIKIWLKEAEESRRIIGNFRAGDLSTLEKKPGEGFKGKPTDTEKVLQGEAKIIDMKNNPNVQGLYTHGAGPCLILVLTGKGEDGKPEKITMAHNSSTTTPADISELIAKTGEKPEKIEADVISGSWDRALMVGKMLEYNRVKVRFANVDLEGTRVDSVAVDRQGTIYYGSIPELNEMSPSDQQRLSELMMRSSYPENSLFRRLDIVEK